MLQSLNRTGHNYELLRPRLATLISGFDLTFQKCFVSFGKKITSRLILNVPHYVWAMYRIFHPRSLKMALSGIFYRTEKHQLYIVYQKTFIKKRLYKRTVWKYKSEIFLIKLCRILHTPRKEAPLLLWKLYKSKCYFYQQQSGLL